MTTLELLDAVEAGISALRSRNGQAAAPRNGHAPAGGSMSPEALRAGLARAALPVAQFAGLAGVGRDEIEDWLEGRAPIPSWVPAAVRVVALLTPSALRTLLSGGVKTQRPAGTHPFSRIEEL